VEDEVCRTQTSAEAHTHTMPEQAQMGDGGPWGIRVAWALRKPP
jgi:hypothetical protein